ncbi:hypothetical protein WJX82_011163 [Trebouxia sp. C0006]
MIFQDTSQEALQRIARVSSRSSEGKGSEPICFQSSLPSNERPYDTSCRRHLFAHVFRFVAESVREVHQELVCSRFGKSALGMRMDGAVFDD